MQPVLLPAWTPQQAEKYHQGGGHTGPLTPLSLSLYLNVS